MSSWIKVFYFVLTLGVLYGLPPQTFADGGGEKTREQRVDPDIELASQAIKRKNWSQAIEILSRQVARDDSDAEAYNLRGDSERMQGDLKAYERALTLDLEHRGAHEYIGGTYLISDNLPKAEEHLARHDKPCFFFCEQCRELKSAIVNYRAEHRQ